MQDDDDNTFSARLRILVERIRAKRYQDMAAADGDREPWTFVGRHEELRRVRRLLATEPIVSVTGPAGIGKSAFLGRLASDPGLRRSFAGIVRAEEGVLRQIEQFDARQRHYQPSDVTDVSGVSLHPLTRLDESLADLVGRPFVYLVDDAVPTREILTVCRHVLEKGGSVVLSWASETTRSEGFSELPVELPTVSLGRLNSADARELLVANSLGKTQVEQGGSIPGFVDFVCRKSLGHPGLLAKYALQLRNASGQKSVSQEIRDELHRDATRFPNATYIARLMNRVIEEDLVHMLYGLSWFEPGEARRADLTATGHLT